MRVACGVWRVAGSTIEVKPRRACGFSVRVLLMGLSHRTSLSLALSLTYDPLPFPQVPLGFVSLRVRVSTGKTIVLQVALDQPLSAVLPLVEALEGAAPGTMRLTQGGHTGAQCTKRLHPRGSDTHPGR